MTSSARLLRYVAMATVTAALWGCASHSTMVNRPIDTQDVPRLLAGSPHVTPLTSKTYAARTSPSAVQLYNYTFHFLNQPDMVKDWQYHYVVGPASQPSWRYERLAEVLVYLPSRADEQAFEQFRTVAAAQGGDAVIDLHRKPIITRRPPAPIDAYLYHGVVVRRTE